MLDVKGILGAHADVPALLSQMITPPEPAALQQGAAWQLPPPPPPAHPAHLAITKPCGGDGHLPLPSPSLAPDLLAC